MTRVEQAQLLLKLAERIRKIELYYAGNIKELALYAANPSKYPLFDENRMKKIAEKRLEGIEALKKKYDRILNSDCSGKITESELIKRGFVFLDGGGSRIFNKRITNKESIVISERTVSFQKDEWLVALHICDYQEEGWFSLRNIKTIKELDYVLSFAISS